MRLTSFRPKAPSSGAPHRAALIPWATAWILLLGPTGAAPATAQEPPGTTASKDDPKRTAESPVDLVSSAALRRALEFAPKRTKIGSMRSVRTYSRIVFATAPDRPHELTFSAAFPERSRLSLRPASPGPKELGPKEPGSKSEPANPPTVASPPGLSERYQLGEATYGRDVLAGGPPSASMSYAQTGAAAAETRFDFALRRCACFWPDEGSFEGAGWSRTTAVEGLGVLLLRLDGASGLPQEIRALGADGREAAKLTAIQWQEIDGRHWPRTFEFWAGGSKIWTETVTSIERDWFLGDPWFLPSDRVGEIVGKKSDKRLRMRVRGASQVQTLPVEPGLSLENAMTAAVREWRDARTEFKSTDPTPGAPSSRGQLLPSAALILDGDGKVQAIELHASVPRNGAAPHVGWSRRTAASEWVYLLENIGRPGPKSSEGSLQERLTEGRKLLLSQGEAARSDEQIRLRFRLADRGRAGIATVDRRLSRSARESGPRDAASPKKLLGTR